MLRESVEMTEESIDLEGLADPVCTRIEGLPHSEALLRFANAFMGDDRAALTQTREKIATEVSPEAMVDAVGVASTFQRVVRIADATGIPTEEPIAIMQEDLAEKLGTFKFISASNTKRISWFKRCLHKLIVIPKIRKHIKNESNQ
jgi:hypothetical protein